MDTYINYLEKVLGLSQVVWPETDPAPTEPIVEKPSERLHVLFLAERPWSSSVQALFEKMREAMKIPGDRHQLIFLSQAQPSEVPVAALTAEHVICFSESAAKMVPEDHPSVRRMHSPEELLKRPELKKETWEELKKVMKELGVL